MELGMARKSILGLSMPTILKEIADRLLADDWIRMAGPDGKRFYYVMGADAWSHEIDTGERFGMTVATPFEVSVSGEYYTRAQIAAAQHADHYMSNAVAAASRVGLNTSAILA
jgi:hypothetical protein